MSNQMKRELEEFRALILRLESDGTNIKDIVDKLVDHQKDIMASLQIWIRFSKQSLVPLRNIMIML